MRVYLPSTMPDLADVLAKGEAGPSPLPAFAVTPALREAYASGDHSGAFAMFVATASGLDWNTCRALLEERTQDRHVLAHVCERFGEREAEHALDDDLVREPDAEREAAAARRARR